MIKNISQIIGYHNTSEKITEIHFHCESRKCHSNQFPVFELSKKYVPICKNCGKFQCNLHINKKKDSCMNCANFDIICSCNYFEICYYCGKIMCECSQLWRMRTHNDNGGTFACLICDEHYEECKSDHNVKIFGKIQ